MFTLGLALAEESISRYSFYNLTFSDLDQICREQSLPEATPSLLYNWHYKKNKRQACELFGFSKKAKDYFGGQVDFALPDIIKEKESSDKTVKFLMQTTGGAVVETVLIPFQGKYSICVSSQAGCLMGCKFCYTGKQGFKSQLQTKDIVGQLLKVREWLQINRASEDKIRNVVFMGQGEPLHNFENVKKACEIFISQYGLSIADHKITVSTSGYLPGLKLWKKEMPPVNLALSLHAVDNNKREKIIPLSAKYSLEEVLDEIDQLDVPIGRFITFEYLLIKNFNDSTDEAQKLGELLKDRPAFLNLIPFNPFPGGEFERPDESQIEKFLAVVQAFSFPVTVRKTKGDEILAACGQLNIEGQWIQ